MRFGIAKRISSLPLRVQLSLLALVVAVPSLAVIAQSGVRVRREAIREAEQESRRLVEGIAAEQDRLVAGTQQLFVALAQLPAVRERDPRVQWVFADILGQSQQYASIIALDRAGVVWTSSPAAGPLDLSDRPYYRKVMATGRLSWGAFQLGRVSRRAVLPLAQPLKDAAGQVTGILVIGIDLGFYRSAFAAAKLHPGSGFVVADREGSIVARSPPQGALGEPDEPELRRRTIEGPDGGTFIAAEAGGSGERIYSYRQMRLPGEAEPYLYVRVGIPLAVVLAGANRALATNLATLVGFLALALLLASWLGGKLVADRIALLRTASQRMAGGETDVRVAEAVRGGDLGRLGQAFDTLAEKLAAREQALQESERQLRQILDATGDAILVYQATSGVVTELNRTAEQMFGYPRAEVLGTAVLALGANEEPSSAAAGQRWVERAQREGPQTFDWLCRRRDGERFWAEVTLKATAIGGEGRLLAVVRDLTERKRAEGERQALQARLVQGQKMESIGRLAGGVAHDFNNMLSVILGEAELLKSQLPEADPRLEGVAQIESAALRSRGITRQLLAFSRRQAIAPRRIDLNARIEAARQTVLRLVGEDVEVRFFPEPHLWPVRLDPAQVDQLLMNLATNARDAMPDGGRLGIETRNVELDEPFCRAHPGASTGPHVALEVSDQGTGMDAETLAHLFEPFFSTKDMGKGTGLGLAIVYGIAKQNRGFVQVDSEVGVGTTFRVYFPRDAGPAAEEERNGAADHGGAARGAVVVVDDDPRVLGTTRRMLESLGYRVEACSSGGQALALLEDAGRAVDLLLTDVVMPGMSGPQLRARAEARRPGLRVLLMSGFNPDQAAGPGEGPGAILQKPFGLAELGRRVREAIEGSGVRVG